MTSTDNFEVIERLKKEVASLRLTLERESEKVSEHYGVIQDYQLKLKMCRQVLRANNIGHLYPGSSKSYEDDMKESMKSGGTELSQSLYFAANFNRLEANHAKEISIALAKIIADAGLTIPEDLLKKSSTKNLNIDDK